MLLVLLVSVVERLLAGANCERDRENERTRERGGGAQKGSSRHKCEKSTCDRARPKLLLLRL